MLFAVGSVVMAIIVAAGELIGWIWFPRWSNGVYTLEHAVPLVKLLRVSR